MKKILQKNGCAYHHTEVKLLSVFEINFCFSQFFENFSDIHKRQFFSKINLSNHKGADLKFQKQNNGVTWVLHRSDYRFPLPTPKKNSKPQSDSEVWLEIISFSELNIQKTKIFTKKGSKGHPKKDNIKPTMSFKKK